MALNVSFFRPSFGGGSSVETRAKLEAIDRAQAVIEFTMEGIITSANDNFLQTMGYRLEEIQGQHHSMFVDPELRRSAEYSEFWSRLRAGEFISSEFRRIDKQGKEVWIQATYNPILDRSGHPVKIIKFATDITAQKVKAADHEGQIAAISKSQAVIEFNMDGTILSANENFLTTMGYSEQEVVGKHHRMFVAPDHANSAEYQAFWTRLRNGEFMTGEFQRFGKDAKEVWIQASYNPIYDLSGTPIKVVKYASDITEQKRHDADYQGQIAAIAKSQAVIEFDMDGVILNANQNFLDAVGYELKDIQGQHHRMFVTTELKNSQEYHDFWQALKEGIFQSGEYMRIGKGGKEIWIQASYNPIFDLSGKPIKVVKYAMDVTEQKRRNADQIGQMAAISKSQAVIEFTLDGVIVDANDNFLATVGYSLSEIKGQHHRLFMPKEDAESQDYLDFWGELRSGQYKAGEFRRKNKAGEDVWIQASYNPILDESGRPTKVVKYASNITEQKQKNSDYAGQIAAIGKSQAVIEFDMNGHILNANENFLYTVGYSAGEILNRHHSMFVSEEERQSSEYRLFWSELKAGKFQSGEYRRIHKNGKDIWIQATYNPIFDVSGHPFKVVKFATEITEEKLKNAYYEGQISAIGKAQAVIEFNLDGTIINANDNFLATMGYELSEIRNQHHSMFVAKDERESPEYLEFWQSLKAGKYHSGEFKRIDKNGEEVWIQASYNPILDLTGTPYKVVKYASNITQQKLQNADYQGQIEAIGKSQAIIEFNMDGTIRCANHNFLAVTGYELKEIVGEHHKKFVGAEEQNSPRYAQFWDKLRKGEFVSGEFKRIDKYGREIWIQASYNPILDVSGRPFKVVKYATDITQQKKQAADFAGQIAAISKSQAVIEFNMDGTIITANDNFLDAVGYTMEEIKGLHHRIFMDKQEREGKEYEEFWTKLRKGQFQSGEYQRVSKDGRTIWIQASYNPIMDVDGRPFKVVKYATEITGRVEAIRAVAESMAKLAEGNLDAMIDIDFLPEFQSLKDAINKTVDRLQEIVTQINQAAQEVSAGVEEIEQGNGDLSTRTEQQAARLEETAASMDRITATVQTNAENSQHASKLAAQAMKRAEVGGNVVHDAIDSMKAITDASKKMNEIIGVIDEIAFQTNLLALNAAVEAARAGEHGRGFSVVATEVRTLAQRSAGAAKEIKELITDSVNKVEDGTKLVNQSGDTLEQIVAAIAEVSEMITDISQLSMEQSSGIVEVNQSVVQMDDMTQQNAALVEEANAASASLNQQAQDMVEMLSFFEQ